MLVTTEYFDKQVTLDVTNPSNPGESSSGGVALGVLYQARMILFTNNITPGKQTALSALTQPTYAGYVSQQISWNPPSRDVLLGVGAQAQTLIWQMQNANTPTTVYGYGIVDPSGTILYGAELFAGGPLGLSDALSFIEVNAEWIANNPNAGQATVVT